MAIGLIASDFHQLFRPDELLSKCSNLMEEDSNITVAKNKHFCYNKVALTIGQLPVLFGTTLIPLYLVVWLIYIQKLHRWNFLSQLLNLYPVCKMLKLTSNKLTILKIHRIEFDLPPFFGAYALCMWSLLKRTAMVLTTL